MRWLPLGLFAFLPLQWFVLPVPAGLRLHLFALFLFTAVTGVRLGFHGVRPVVRASAAFVVAFLVLTVLVLATDVYHGRSPRAAIELTMLLAGALSFGAVIRRAVREDGQALALLRWCGPVCLLSLVSALTFSLRTNGVDPVAVLGRAIAQGSPQVLQREFYAPAFVGFGLADEAVKSQLRHEIFGALLLANLVSFAAMSLRPFRSRFAVAMMMACTTVSLILLTASLSRAVSIAALTWPLLSWWRRISSGGLTARSQLTVAAVLVVGVATSATGILAVVWVRFTQDTSSYEARDGLLHRAVVNIGKHWLTGGVGTVGKSSHNFVLDYWLRSGVFAAATAVFILVGLLIVAGAMIVRLPGEPAWMVPAVAALCLVLVRMFTAGGGAIPPVEWLALGLVAGLLTTRIEGRPAPRVVATTSSSRTDEPVLSFVPGGEAG